MVCLFEDRKVMSNEVETSKKNSNYYFLWALEMKVLRELLDYLSALIILFEISE